MKAACIAALGALLAWVQLPAMAEAACANPEDTQDLACRSWISSERALFAARGGKLFRMHFDGTHSDLLVDHGFTSLAFSFSADARYIAYVGDSGGRFSAFVYDNADGTDHRLPITDPRQVRLEFSADGSKLAWADVAPQGDQRNIVIMTLADRSMQSVHYPVDPRMLGDYRTTQVHWSIDGQQLLVGSVAYPKGAYYRIGMPTLTITPIDGRFVPYVPPASLADAGMHFGQEGHELAYYRQPCLQWQCVNQGRPAIGESVQIDKNHMMTVTTPEGVERVVARGGCDQCGNASVKVLSWLEHGKYLVYQLRGATYVYGVAESRTARLFDPGWRFGWRDDENRAPSFSYP